MQPTYGQNEHVQFQQQYVNCAYQIIQNNQNHNLYGTNESINQQQYNIINQQNLNNQITEQHSQSQLLQQQQRQNINFDINKDLSSHYQQYAHQLPPSHHQNYCNKQINLSQYSIINKTIDNNNNNMQQLLNNNSNQYNSIQFQNYPQIISQQGNQQSYCQMPYQDVYYQNQNVSYNYFHGNNSCNANQNQPVETQTFIIEKSVKPEASTTCYQNPTTFIKMPISNYDNTNSPYNNYQLQSQVPSSPYEASLNDSCYGTNPPSIASSFSSMQSNFSDISSPLNDPLCEFGTEENYFYENNSIGEMKNKKSEVTSQNKELQSSLNISLRWIDHDESLLTEFELHMREVSKQQSALNLYLLNST